MVDTSNKISAKGLSQLHKGSLTKPGTSNKISAQGISQVLKGNLAITDISSNSRGLLKVEGQEISQLN